MYFAKKYGSDFKINPAFYKLIQNVLFIFCCFFDSKISIRLSVPAESVIYKHTNVNA